MKNVFKKVFLIVQNENSVLIYSTIKIYLVKIKLVNYVIQVKNSYEYTSNFIINLFK